MDTYHVLGLMSGSSMDGLDIAFCILEVDDNGKWSYKIEKSECIEYSRKWHMRLRNLTMQNAITYIKTHTYYGHYVAETVNDFIDRNGLAGSIDFIASHGQTIFHQPENFLTSQIGDGGAISALTQIPVVSNFRTQDVALGGQGAPIVPVGDKLLFPDHTFCVNLGGIANVSAKLPEGKMIGYDVCAMNLVLNRLSESMGQSFDEGGEIARSGRLDARLLEELDRSWYYDKAIPKTIGGGWVRKVLMPVFRHYRIPVEDKLHTYVEHVAKQINKDIEQLCVNNNLGLPSEHKVLYTGGGAMNEYLMERIKEHSQAEVEVPDPTLIKFKEALIMALVGTLRWRSEVNCLANVTGASRDSIGGEIYG